MIAHLFLSVFKERTTYITTVEALENEIHRSNSKLKELKGVSKDAEALRDKARDEFRRHEELAYAYRKRRELEMVNMRRTLEMCKQQEITTKNLVVRKHVALNLFSSNSKRKRMVNRSCTNV